MNVLLQNVTILDPLSPHHRTRTDLLIENGMIRQIGKYITPEGMQVVQGNNLHVSPGWLDLHAHLRDPGYEYKETLESGAAAAARGGFTAILALPETSPPVQTKSAVEYIVKRSQPLAVDIYPAGALSQDLEGKELAELYDMHLAGAKAFTDGDHPVAHAGLLVRALMYAHNFGGRIHVRCDEKSISQGGQMNEGAISTMLGLKGIPTLAEELTVARNIHLAEYAGSTIHLMAVSSAGSVQLIREAQKKGLSVTAAVHASNLFWTDAALEDFDTNFKMSPPLRTAADRQALLDGIADGTISCITSGHAPEDVESKMVEFDLASPGITALETTYSLAVMAGVSPENLVNALCHHPRGIAGVEIPVIKTGVKANLTVFDPATKWKFLTEDIRSKSKNTPVPGMELTGKVVGIYNKGKWVGG